LDLLRSFADGDLGFAAGVLGAAEWIGLLRHVEKWAHFVRFPPHEAMRSRESALVEATFASLTPSQKAEILPSLETDEAPDPRPGAEFTATMARLQESATDSAIKELIDRFSQPDGLEFAWGSTDNHALKSLLFDPASALYADTNYFSQFRALALCADEDLEIQRNFLTFFRQLAYGALEGGSFPTRPCRELLSQQELLEAVWAAAVTRPLNPRTASSLRRYRSTIGTNFAPLEAMPVPEWWQALERGGYFTHPTAADADQPPGGSDEHGAAETQSTRTRRDTAESIDSAENVDD
jgi:hypothetical protein